MKYFVLFFKYCFLHSQRFSTNKFIMLQDFFFEASKIIDFWKCLLYFLFKDCILGLLLKSKVGSIIMGLFCLMSSSFVCTIN